MGKCLDPDPQAKCKLTCGGQETECLQREEVLGVDGEQGGHDKAHVGTRVDDGHGRLNKHLQQQGTLTCQKVCCFFT